MAASVIRVAAATGGSDVDGTLPDPAEQPDSVGNSSAAGSTALATRPSHRLAKVISVDSESSAVNASVTEVPTGHDRGNVTPSRPQTDDRRREVLRAASELFAREGYHAVGMRAIGDASGMRGASLYHYFPSKVDILKAVVVEMMGAFVEWQLHDLAPSPTYTARMRMLVSGHVLYLRENRMAQAVGEREFRELRIHRPEAYEELLGFVRRYRDSIEGFINRGCEAGEFTCSNPRLTAMVVIGMLNSVNDWYDPRRDGTIEELACKYATLVVTNLLGSKVDSAVSVG